jgi:pyrimidine oxygenase
LPTARVPFICAAQSDAGTRFAAPYADYNFCTGGGINQPTAVAARVARLVDATAETGRDCGALILQMIIADETDAAAMAKWEHSKAGTDIEALAWRDAEAEDDPSNDPYAQPNRRKTLGVNHLPTNQGVFVGSYASVAQMLDEMATVPGVRGVMLTFDDFIIGMEQFGTRILPLMRYRSDVRQAA